MRRRDDATMHDDSYLAHLSSTRVICTTPILYAISTRARTNETNERTTRRIFLSRPTVHFTRLSIAPARASPPTTPRARATRTRHHRRREFRLPSPSPRALDRSSRPNARGQRVRAAINRRTRDRTQWLTQWCSLISKSVALPRDASK